MITDDTLETQRMSKLVWKKSKQSRDISLMQRSHFWCAQNFLQSLMDQNEENTMIKTFAAPL